MRTRGWTARFVPTDWNEVRQFLGGLAKGSPEFGYLAEILASIVSSGRADDLTVTTSMHDPVITPRPVPEPPLDVVIVRAPNSLRNGPRPGHVVIEEMSLTGHGDLIERPAAESCAALLALHDREVRRASESLTLCPTCRDPGVGKGASFRRVPALAGARICDPRVHDPRLPRCGFHPRADSRTCLLSR